MSEVPAASLWWRVGLVLLGLYFIGPGLMKVFAFGDHVSYMQAHNVPMAPLLLVITTVLQLAAGGALVAGFRVPWAALILAGLTLAISIGMHDFWNFEEGTQRAHETQNFIKNLGIMAGLLALAGGTRHVPANPAGAV